MSGEDVQEMMVPSAAADEDIAVGDDELMEDDFIGIDQLVEQGVNAGDIKKLKDGGFWTIGQLLMTTRKHLGQVKGISEAKIDKLLEAASKMSDRGCFRTGAQILQTRHAVLHVTTGSKDLDTLLGGGVETRSITEAFGEFRTGKTQICHTLCVTCQLPPDQGGGSGKVVYIDTEGTFRPERIQQIAERFGVDPTEALENILVARVFTHEQQMAILPHVVAKMAEEPFRMLIMDSVTALFRVDFSGRGELAERQQKLAQMLSMMMKIAEEFNVAVFMTNQVVSDPGAAAMFVSDPKKPVGGHILAHASTTRLSLRKGRGDTRVCKIYDSPNLPEAEAVYAISDGGIVDPKD